MAKLYPSRQDFHDLRDRTTIGVTRVKILSTTTDNVFLPNAVDAAILQTSDRTSDPAFYLFDRNTFSIDSATVGTEYVIVSRHEGMINFGSGEGSL